MVEREIKVKVSQAIFEKELARFPSVEVVDQEDTYFDFPDCRNLNAKRDLRVRTEAGILASIQFKTIFFLPARGKWVVEEFDFNESTAGAIFARLGVDTAGISVPALDDSAAATAFFRQLGLRAQLVVAKKRRRTKQDWGEICFDQLEGLGYFIELEMLAGEPEGKLAELGIEFEEAIRLGYTELFCDRDPKRFIGSHLKERMFKRLPSWNVSSVDLPLYHRLSSRRVVWSNLSCIVYDISVPFYLEQLALGEENIELCYVNYWDNLLFADALVDRALPGLKMEQLLQENVRRITMKLDSLLPQRHQLLRHTELANRALPVLQRPLNHVASALDRRRMQQILSKSRISLQILNNMVEDFLLCCFASRLGLRRVDVYYVGTRFKPLESIFRQYGAMGEEGFFLPRVEYIDLPRFPKDADGNRVNPYMTYKEIVALAHSPDVDARVVDWLAVSRDALAEALHQKMAEVALDTERGKGA
ncbi:MAG TPA: CYTH domain-containing protein [Anaerolineales bacterium]|nr:CYTH domain-containing protein [Anaerolineales bacterium]